MTQVKYGQEDENNDAGGMIEQGYYSRSRTLQGVTLQR